MPDAIMTNGAEFTAAVVGLVVVIASRLWMGRRGERGDYRGDREVVGLGLISMALISSGCVSAGKKECEGFGVHAPFVTVNLGSCRVVR